MAQTVVDIIPRYDPSGHFAKIADTGPNQLNNKVNSLINLIEYTEGHNSIFPSMGAYKTINSIPFSESVDNILGQLSSRVTEFMGTEVTYHYHDNPDTPEIKEIDMYVENLPGKIRFDVATQNNTVRILNPKYFKE